MRGAERETRDAYLGVIAEKARVTALQQSVKSNLTALEATRLASRSARARPWTCSTRGDGCSKRSAITHAAATTT